MKTMYNQPHTLVLSFQGNNLICASGGDYTGGDPADAQAPARIQNYRPK